jgi:hypothetical protein
VQERLSLCGDDFFAKQRQTWRAWLKTAYLLDLHNRQGIDDLEQRYAQTRGQADRMAGHAQVAKKRLRGGVVRQVDAVILERFLELLDVVGIALGGAVGGLIRVVVVDDAIAPGSLALLAAPML